MNYEYTLALFLPEGGEAPLRAYLNTMEKQFSFAYPLPLFVPVGGFKESFPPDRVDRRKLKELRGLSFQSVTTGSEGYVLSLTDPVLTEEAADCLKGIHGKEKPCPLPLPLFPWKGILLHPEGFPHPAKGKGSYPTPPQTVWHTYRLGLIKTSWPEQAPWWNHISWEVLWHIRKPRSARTG